MDDLNNLLRLLQSVKEIGSWDELFGVANLHAWRGTRSPNNNPFSYPDPLFSMRQLLEDSKRCMKALNNARQNLGINIRALQRRCMPLVLEDGIKRLPDELLIRVFEMGHDMTEDAEFALRVSHVSRRFREASFKTPLLWTRLTMKDSVNLTREFLSRAGTQVLDIKTMYALESKMTSFLTLVSPLSRQWSRLTVFDKEVKDALTTVDLFFDAFGELDVPSLARALHLMPNLQHLSLDLFNCVRADNVTPLEPQDIPKRHSVNIQTLEITVECTRHDLVQELNDALAYLTPSTVNISLILDLADGQASSFLHTSNDEFFPYGSTVQLTITHCPVDIFHTLMHLVENCDILSSAQMEAPNAHINISLLSLYNWQKSQSLRHLRFRNCDTLTEEDVEILTRELISPGDDGGLESLEFKSCKKLSEEFFLDLGSGVEGKVKWIL
ncbi:hypothetical protein BD410DRAFT_800199 [Rickenella mellea]|uniref:F-box domain-containing protein n=1 Tax=Rickenella mellea TaxID=50990 RepID=A0A4Y7QJY8_9AGAM|nr:hypothetical protein BD410DRAFT_800199 [Rickenella mellea]